MIFIRIMVSWLLIFFFISCEDKNSNSKLKPTITTNKINSVFSYLVGRYKAENQDIYLEIYNDGTYINKRAFGNLDSKNTLNDTLYHGEWSVKENDLYITLLLNDYFGYNGNSAFNVIFLKNNEDANALERRIYSPSKRIVLHQYNNMLNYTNFYFKIQ